MEAPRWYWSGGHMEADVRKETERTLTLTAPGPHAFLMLVPVGQFTEVSGCTLCIFPDYSYSRSFFLFSFTLLGISNLLFMSFLHIDDLIIDKHFLKTLIL